MTPSPASWYPDPAKRFQYRYWDGTRWTDQVATAGVQSTNPLYLPDEGIGATSPAAVAPSKPVESSEGHHLPEQRPGMFARMREEHEAKSSGRDEFEALATRAALGDPDAIEELPAAVSHARSLYRSTQLDKVLWDTMAKAVRSVIDDDVLTSDEEDHLHRLGDSLGTPVQEIEKRDHGLFEELVIAGINDGRFPTLANPGMMLKRGEQAYGSFSASLMKDQTIREFRGGSQSVSIPLGGGVRYRVGGVRGRAVVVGTQVVVQDSGVLYVTNQRAVFTGRVKTLEFRNDRMVGLEQYTDGLRLSVSNRQTASLFRMENPSIAAALITSSVAHSV